MDRRAPVMIQTLEGLLAALRFNYHIMVASVPLLELAAERARRSEPLLSRYYEEHAAEELHHDEWLKEDIAELGGELQGPDHMAACIAGSQYYYLRHLGTVPLLGYLAALEFRPLSPEALGYLETLTGGKGLRTLRHHSRVDPQHAAELGKVIESFKTERLIAYNAVMTHNLYMTYVAQRVAEVTYAPEAPCRAIH